MSDNEARGEDQGVSTIVKQNKSLRIVFWGTYDRGKPRVRLLLKGARSAGINVLECHTDVWREIEDKSQISGLKYWIKRLLFWLYSYPSLIWRYMRLPPHDAVLVCYLGQVDVLVLKPFARLRGVPVIWDAFLSLYDTTVLDRRMISQRSPLAWILYALEWLACRAADEMFLDTEVHARYFEKLFRLPADHVGRVFVGAETEVFPFSPEKTEMTGKGKSFTVLFYGQFIPLHGIDTIVRAAWKAEILGEKIRWILIGRGQESQRIDKLVNDLGVSTIKRIQWVPYAELIQWIADADVCLGIFAATAKASRVIPNKMYQILAADRPLITADSPAVRELFYDSERIRLIPPGNPEKLVEALIELKNESFGSVCRRKHETPTHRVIGTAEVGIQLQEIITKTLSVRE